MRWFDSVKADFGAEFSAFLAEPRGAAEEIDAAVAEVIESVRREGMDAVIEASPPGASGPITPVSGPPTPVSPTPPGWNSAGGGDRWPRWASMCRAAGPPILQRC